MKKIVLFSLLIASLVGFTSCKNNDSPAMGAKVNVYVKNALGAVKDGVTVYMYDKEVDSSTTKAEAKKQIVTNSAGIASFDLNFTELNITESQTTVYFAVFYTVGDNEIPVDQKGITLQRNQVYEVNLTMPL